MFKTLLGKSIPRTGLARVLRGESLEQRHMMAGDTYLPYHNDLISEDTNQDYNVTALDALLVINAINSLTPGATGVLPTDGVGKADGPRIDVSGDNALTALDALQVINRLNGEGEVGDLVGFSYQFTDTAGVALPNNTASVGQLVQLRTFVQDLRGLSAKGVFTAFLDMNFSDSSKFQVNVGEGQSFRYDFDRISGDTGSFFKFTFNGQTTAPVGLYDADGNARTGSDLAPVIQAALAALPNIGAGNVVVREDAVANAADNTANRLRNNFDIIFVNQLAGQNVDLITVDTSGVIMQPGQTLTFDLVDKYPADPNNPTALAAAFFFTNEFTTGRNAALGTEGGVSQFNEVGATGGLGAPTSPGARRLFFTVTLKALDTGSVTFTPNPAEDFPAHETLVFPKDVVPTDLIEYGAPFTLNIASSVLANNDTFTVAEDAASASYNVTSNDTLISGNPFTITAVGPTSNGGTVSIAAGATQVNYQPAANFFGPETFTYTITNNAGSSTATVTMTVTSINDPISVPNQTAATNLGKAVTKTTAELTQGGSAGAGESTQVLNIASVNSPSANGGTVSLQSGSVVYAPAAGFTGVDTFTIVVSDNGQTNGADDFKTQSVTVTVTVTNDPPNAVDDLIDTVDEESTNNTLDVLANDTAGANDVNDSLTITATGGTPTGTVSIAGDGKSLVYTPASGFVGQDTFTYTVRDTGGATDTATVTVDVQATVLPRARVDQAQSTEDTATPTVINVLQNDRTNVGSVPVLISFAQPANGTVTLNDNGTPADASDDTLSYLPNANFSGNDIFTYVMNETPGSDTSANSTGTVTVAVAAVNDPPIIANDNAAAVEDTVTTFTSTTLLSNDSPGTGESSQQTLTITFAQAVSATGGSVAVSGGNVIYTPAANFNGTFVFTYVATDNGSPAQTGTGTVTVTVSAVNDAPVAGNDSETAVEDTPKTITATTLLANDTPGPASATDEASQTLSVVAVSPASANGGTVALNGTSVVYTPALNFNGTDTFTYTVRDNGSPTAQSTGTVTLTVSAVNDAPIAGADAAGTSKGVAVTISPTTLLANDSPGPANESAQTLSISSVSGAVNGTVVLVGGQIIFTPAANFSGAASFQYVVTDNGQTNAVNDFKTATGTVSVNVEDFRPSTLTGLVYVDETNDGVKQASERTLGGVTVNLTGTALSQAISRSDTTLADGSYSFGNLAPGVYTVSIVNPTLMIDGLDTPGTLGDSDGVAHNNSFSFTIGGSGGLDISGYNFGVIGVTDGYASTMERLASRYFASGSTQANNGLYATLGSDGSQQWFTRLNGYDEFVFAEVAMNSAGTEAYLTVVDSAHNVKTATLGRGKFITMFDNAGNTIVRVLGGYSQLNFSSVSLSAPPVRSANKFLDAIDQIFAQQGW